PNAADTPTIAIVEWGQTGTPSHIGTPLYIALGPFIENLQTAWDQSGNNNQTASKAFICPSDLFRSKPSGTTFGPNALLTQWYGANDTEVTQGLSYEYGRDNRIIRMRGSNASQNTQSMLYQFSMQQLESTGKGSSNVLMVWDFDPVHGIE